MSACIHCNQESNQTFFESFNNQKIGPFCCNGCLTVYKVIKNKGLSEYYDIKQSVASYKKRAPVSEVHSQYKYLDDSEFLNEYAYKNTLSNLTMEFYLEGIHCLACLWIIEKLPEFIPGVVAAKLNMGKSVVTVSVVGETHFSLVAKELDAIGYTPHPLKKNQETQTLKTKEERSFLLKIGISAAASMNIMLYAVSLYAGAKAQYEIYFNLLTVIFAIPVLTYCAYPFYKSSYYALKNKTLSIDVPISMALIMGGIMGIYNFFIGVHENYFDSLTALVFLLLISRYFLKTIQEKGLSTNDLHFFYQGSIVFKKLEDGSFTEIHPKFIKKDDVLKIGVNEMIPADGIIVSGNTYINNSLLTGESELLKCHEFDQVFSGTMNISNEIEIRVLSNLKESRLGKILKDLENGWGQKANIVNATNKISKYFVVVVLLLALGLYIYLLQSESPKSALEQALTLLIVTCPCALAIATPLTFIRSLSKSASKGIIIKDDLTIEQLTKSKKIFLDKTGTITYNKLEVSHFNIIDESATEIYDIIFSLEKKSRHPVGVCLRKFVEAKGANEISIGDLKEIPGIGVCAESNNHFYEIRNYEIFKDYKVIAHFSVDDKIRPEAKEAIATLKHMGYEICILSGDNHKKVSKIASELNISSSEFLAEISPEEKANIIKNNPHSIMVGDGANDALALNHADVGIAVFGAMDISLRASDVYMTQPGIREVLDLITISKETMKVIYRNFALSLCYNSISVLLAFTGYISPLTAAIIMPVSSLTVLLSTLIGTKRLRALWK